MSARKTLERLIAISWIAAAVVVYQPIPEFKRYRSPDAIPVLGEPYFPPIPRRPSPLPAAIDQDLLADDWFTSNVFNPTDGAYLQLMLPAAQLFRTWDKWYILYREIIEGLTPGWTWTRAQGDAVWAAPKHRASIGLSRRQLARYIEHQVALTRCGALASAASFGVPPMPANSTNNTRPTAESRCRPSATNGGARPWTVNVVQVGSGRNNTCDMLLGSHGDCAYRSDTAGWLDILFSRPETNGRGPPDQPTTGQPYPAWLTDFTVLEPNPAARDLLAQRIHALQQGAAVLGAWTRGEAGRNLASDRARGLSTHRAAGQARVRPGTVLGMVEEDDAAWASLAAALPFTHRTVPGTVCEGALPPTGDILGPLLPDQAHTRIEADGTQADGLAADGMDVEWRTGSAQLLVPSASLATALSSRPWSQGMEEVARLVNPLGQPIPFAPEIDPVTRKPKPGSMPTARAIPDILRELRRNGEYASTNRPPRGDWPADMNVPIDFTPGLTQDDPARFAFGAVVRRMEYDTAALAALVGTAEAEGLRAVEHDVMSVNCTSVQRMAGLVDRATASLHGTASPDLDDQDPTAFNSPSATRWADVLLVSQPGMSESVVQAVLDLARATASAQDTAETAQQPSVPPQDVAAYMPFLLVFEGPTQPMFVKPPHADRVPGASVAFGPTPKPKPGAGPGRHITSGPYGTASMPLDTLSLLIDEEMLPQATVNRGAVSPSLLVRLRSEVGYRCRYIASSTMVCTLPLEG